MFRLSPWSYYIAREPHGARRVRSARYRPALKHPVVGRRRGTSNAARGRTRQRIAGTFMGRRGWFSEDRYAMNFAEQVPSKQWAALKFRGEKLAQVWFKPEGEPWALLFRVPQSSFQNPGI